MAYITARIQKRLLNEFERAKRARKEGEPRLTVERLLARTGLPIDRSTLHRKLHGSAPTTEDEAEAIAGPLGVRLRFRSTVTVRRAA